MSHVFHPNGTEWTVNTAGAYLEALMAASQALSVEQWGTQKAVNIASNEWRGTVGDLKRDFSTRAEMASLETRFVSEQLATARLIAATAAVVESKKEIKEDWKSWAAIAIAVGAVLYPSLNLNLNHVPAPAPAPAPIVIVVPAGAQVTPPSTTPTTTTTTRP